MGLNKKGVGLQSICKIFLDLVRLSVFWGSSFFRDAPFLVFYVNSLLKEGVLRFFIC